jgi:hypothetical protein
MVRLPLEQRATAEPPIAAEFSQSGTAAMAEDASGSAVICYAMPLSSVFAAIWR